MDRTRLGPVTPLGWSIAGSFGLVVAAVTLAIRAHELPAGIFDASAAKIAAGEIWLLPASALVVDRPVYVGLLTFALIGFTALLIGGTRVFWVAGVLGHIGSTLAVYAIIGAARLTDPDAFAGAFARPDSGVSAMQGAWVGVIATTAWGWAGIDIRARALVATGVCALVGVAWWLHPDPSILTTEHLFAFWVGCGVVSWPRWVTRGRTLVGVAGATSHQKATTVGWPHEPRSP